MAKHMSLRLAWHSDGWNGHICKKPCENGYCIGQHSYPGTHILENRDLDYEEKHAGECISSHECKIACALSANAFGKDTIKAEVKTPSWWDAKGGADSEIITLPPYTACTWAYEAMYKNDVFSGDKWKTYDYDKRQKQAEDFFSQFEEGRSLIFYYAGYSNPFSEDEEDNYIIAGISKIKHIDDFHYYPNASDEIKKTYAGAVVWQKPITSAYPDEGFCIPYWKYMDNEKVLQKIVIKPQNRSPFKYGSREVTNDDAIDLINQFISVVDYLIEINDDTENWAVRKEWLNKLLIELWKARGPFPGFTAILPSLNLSQLVQPYTNLSDETEIKDFINKIRDFFNSKDDELPSIQLGENEIKKLRREFSLKDDEEQKLLLEILPRFDLTPLQVEHIISEERKDYSITSSLKDIVANPYIIFEQYIGMDNDDNIPFYKIDNGIISSPEYGLENILDIDSGERLRALCIDELNRIAAHSFGKAETILNYINSRLDKMPEWKRCIYKLKNFIVDEEILNQALYLRRDEKDDLYLYLKSVYEDERTIQSVFEALAERGDIPLKMAITEEKFKKNLRDESSELNKKAKEKYEEILQHQAETCMKIFNKSICVLSGAAGTGKTTVIKAIVENIERIHGQASAFLLMAPTGKATERIKNQTGKTSSTIHSFLASNGWINKNFTFKTQGKTYQDVNTIIIDECSMIDLNLFATLIRAINWNSVQRLILVGDPNQLPPIGRGKVFADTIDWLKTNYKNNIGKLEDNIRHLANEVEGNGTGILDLADIFIQEKQITETADTDRVLDLKQKKENLFNQILENGNGDVVKDLGVYFWKEQENLESTLKYVMLRDMENLTGLKVDREKVTSEKIWQAVLKLDDNSYKPEKIQIISPYRGEFYGTDMINKFFQKEFNENNLKRFSPLDGITFGDKVIQTVNRPKSNPAIAYDFSTGKNEKREIYNGEIGMAWCHPFDKKYMWQNFPVRKFQVSFSNENRKNLKYNYGKDFGKNEKGWNYPEQKVSENLELAYAISVHKSQGSEFDYVYIIIPKRDSHLLSMELLYTALTRAQKKVTVFLQDDISTLSTLSHIDKSAVRRINSSVFKFEPLPEEMLYIQNWYADERKLATLSEYFVRSKSEVIIANLLVHNDIPFIYEQPLYASDGTMYLPDFTVKFKGETYYWEHVGRLDLPNYKTHWEQKEKWYNKNFSGKLIKTFEDPNLSKIAEEIILEHK